MNEDKYCGYDADSFLNEVAKKFGIDTDNKLASKLGVTRAAISQYKSGARVMDDYCATQVARLLNINPMLVIAAANEKREKQELKKEYWRNIQVTLTTGGALFYSAILAVGFLSVFSFNSKAYAESDSLPPYILCAYVD